MAYGVSLVSKLNRNSTRQFVSNINDICVTIIKFWLINTQILVIYSQDIIIKQFFEVFLLLC